LTKKWEKNRGKVKGLFKKVGLCKERRGGHRPGDGENNSEKKKEKKKPSPHTQTMEQVSECAAGKKSSMLETAWCVAKKRGWGSEKKRKTSILGIPIQGKMGDGGTEKHRTGRREETTMGTFSTEFKGKTGPGGLGGEKPGKTVFCPIGGGTKAILEGGNDTVFEQTREPFKT